MSFLTNFDPIADQLAAADRYDLVTAYREIGGQIDRIDALLAENAAAHEAEVANANASVAINESFGPRLTPAARAELFALADLLSTQRTDLLNAREDLLTQAVTLEDEMQSTLDAAKQAA